MNIVREATWGTTPAGIATDAFTIPLLNSVSIGPIVPTAINAGHVRDGKNSIQERYTGSGRLAAGFTGAQTPLTPRVMQWLFANFLQNATTALAAADLTQDLNYTGAQCLGSGGTPAGCPYTFDKIMGAAAACERMAGGVITKIGIDLPQLGQGVVTFDAIGEDEAQPGSIDTDPTILTDTALCTKDMTFEWATAPIVPISANIEFTNSAFPVWTKGTAPVAILRGPLAMTASLTFDWGAVGATWESSLRTGAVSQFELFWGTATNTGYFHIDIDAKITGNSQTEADGLERFTVNFEGMLGTSSASSFDIVTNAAQNFDFAT